MYEITFGDPHFGDDGIKLTVSGVIGKATMDEVESKLTPLLRPPGITLDLKDAKFMNKGVVMMLWLQLAHKDCRIKLINVDPSARADFERNSAGQMGLQISYADEPVKEQE
ncbi:MAG TPA: hypothetical protein VGQ87_00755 [Patescibacteria group bacterium]|jgi:hypothetical protein|nr:hypothetical protein [Patescibacteria group bacterium]